MHWLATLLFALACTGSTPSPDADPAADSSTPGNSAAETSAAGPSAAGDRTPGNEPMALSGAVDLDAPAAIPWTSPPDTWRKSSLGADPPPTRAELLDEIRRVDPSAPAELRSPIPGQPHAADAWQPRWGRVETDQRGRWLLWWNQDEPTWVAWEVSPGEGEARALYAGSEADRPDWLVAVTAPPLSTTVDPVLAGSPQWWQRYAAALQLPLDAFDARLSLARDPHPAVRGAAVAALTWTLRHAEAPAVLQERAAATRALVSELVASTRPADRTGAAALALASLDPAALAATVPLLCDADPDVGPAALSILAPLLPDDALRPWLVHPLWDVGRAAARGLAQATAPEPGTPQAAAWPALRDAAATAWSAAACAPSFDGRYDLAIWSPALATDGVAVTLRDTSGAVVGQGSAVASPSWTRALAIDVSAPPATLVVEIGAETLSEPAPLGGGAALGMACSAPAAPPVFDSDPAEVWRATIPSPGRARCLDATAPDLYQAAVPLAEDPLLDHLATLLSPLEAQAVAARFARSDRPEPLRRTIAQRFLVPLRGADCLAGARALLGTDLVSGDLALRLRRCHRQHPELYRDVLAAVENGDVAVDNLLPMPATVDDDTALRIRQVAADALLRAAPADREGPFRVLMGASGGNPARGPRHTTVLTLPEGGAAVGLPDACDADTDAESEGGFDFAGGSLRLRPIAHADDGPLRVELLDVEQAVSLVRITCGDRVLWEAPTP